MRQHFVDLAAAMFWPAADLMPPAARMLRLALLAAGMLLIAPAQGQEAPVTGPDTTLLTAVEAFEAGDYDRAEQMLEPIVQAQAGSAAPKRGTAAYWLGRVYEVQGETQRMQAVWREGLDDMVAGGRFDVRLGDAYLRALSAEDMDAQLYDAVPVYGALMQSLGAPLAPEAQRLLARHVAQLLLILPPNVARQILQTAPDAPPATWTYAPDAPDVLLSWWRSADPLPATRQNERLEEHLRRVAYAETQYASDESRTGLDIRGEVYVRYGEPDRTTRVTFDGPEMVDLLRPGVTVNLSDFPENEFWLYGHVDRSAYFLFVEDAGTYRLADTADLLPQTLRFGFSATERGQLKSYMLLTALQTIFRRLAPLHSDFANRQAEIDNYKDQFEQDRFWGERMNLQVRPPHQFAESFLLSNAEADEMATYRRETLVPEQATEAYRDLDLLPLAVRTMRFLDDDGTTRTEIVWAPEPDGLAPTRARRRELRKQGYTDFEDAAIRMTAVQRDADYAERVVNRKHYVINDLQGRGGGAIPAQEMVVRGDTGLYHLAFQWDQHMPLPGARATSVQLGPKVKVAAHYVDSLTALTADEQVLEMSDLRPEYRLKDESGAVNLAVDAKPYPFGSIAPDLGLSLYFEVYHLTRGPDDRTHYTVEYIVERQDSGGVLTFLGGGGDERTTAAFRYEGDARTAQESILVDLSEWTGRGDLQVTVRVTDETTQQQVERSIVFGLGE